MKHFFKLFLILLFFSLLSTPSLAAPCPAASNPYRPSGDCEDQTNLIHQNIDEYQLTCTAEPIVNVNINEPSKPSNLSYSSLPCTQEDEYDRCIKKEAQGTFLAEVYAHLDRAQLGGFGANSQVIFSSSPDQTAQIYPFQALFDQPNSYYPTTDDSPLPREAYRTYWRTTPFFQQVKAKARLLRKTKKYPDLALPSLKEKEEYQHYELRYFDSQGNPKTKSLRDLSQELGKQARCLLVVDPTIDVNLLITEFAIRYCNYSKAYSKLEPNTKAAYDALLPFPTDNYRSYLAQLNQTSPQISSLFGENLAYLSALDKGLNHPNSGLINLYSPQWINQERQSSLVSSDTINSNTESRRTSSIVSQLQNQISSDRFNLNQCDRLFEAVYLPAPLTHPQHLALSSSMRQEVLVPVQIIVTYDYQDQFDLTPSSEWSVQGHATGRPIVVANNPTQTDINTSLSALKDSPLSLYNFLTPNSTSSPDPTEDTRIRAPASSFDTDNSGVQISNTTSGDNSPPFPRQAGQSHINLCQLKNKWFLPANAQDKDLDCTKLDTSIITTGRGNIQTCQTPPIQHLFETSCPNDKLCYQHIFEQLQSRLNSSNQIINPYFAIAISLNENGGLTSTNSDYTSLKHFGCDPYGQAGYSYTLDGKLDCMISTLLSYHSGGLDQKGSLSRYGYQPGNNLLNIIDLLKGPSDPSLWVSPSQARQYTQSLAPVLSSQSSSNFWQDYYSGYLDSLCQ